MQFAPRVPYAAPSGVTGTVREYVEDVAGALNALPVFSLFSATHPYSLVTGTPGSFAVNVTTASNVSRVWVHFGGAVPDRTSWRTVI